MRKEKQATLEVLGTGITVLSDGTEDYLSLTDMVSNVENGGSLIYGWMRNRNVIEFLGIWEQLHNPDFKGIEFDTFKMQAGLNNFTMTPRKWIDATGAIGIRSAAGRYNGGTFAHKDIAFEFGSWLSPEFKLYLIKDFQRLKTEESLRESQEWSLNRALSKINYRVHTEAVKQHLIPEKVTPEQAAHVYAQEADLLNVAMFGQTASQWRSKHGKNSNIRDEATIEQLLVLANIENMNAAFITMGMSQKERIGKLNELARTQMKALEGRGIARRLRDATSQPKLSDDRLT